MIYLLYLDTIINLKYLFLLVEFPKHNIHLDKFNVCILLSEVTNDNISVIFLHPDKFSVYIFTS